MLNRRRNSFSRFSPGSRSPRAAPETIYVLTRSGGTPELLLTHSTAILALLKELPRPWPAVASVLGLIPRPIRDLVYRFVARNRFQIHPRLDACPVPAEDERRHFIS